MQRRRGKLRLSIASLPLSLGLLGSHFVLDMNGLGMLFRVNDLMVAWTTFSIRKKTKKSVEGNNSSLFWAIWKETNRVVFDNDYFSLDRLKNSFITYLTS